MTYDIQNPVADIFETDQTVSLNSDGKTYGEVFAALLTALFERYPSLRFERSYSYGDWQGNFTLHSSYNWWEDEYSFGTNGGYTTDLIESNPTVLKIKASGAVDDIFPHLGFADTESEFTVISCGVYYSPGA